MNSGIIGPSTSDRSIIVVFVAFCAKIAVGLNRNVRIVVNITISGSGIIDASFPLPNLSAISISILIITPMIKITRISGRYSITARTDSETHDMFIHSCVTNLLIYTVISF